jgi:hypothetical protein
MSQFESDSDSCYLSLTLIAVCKEPSEVDKAEVPLTM